MFRQIPTCGLSTSYTDSLWQRLCQLRSLSSRTDSSQIERSENRRFPRTRYYLTRVHGIVGSAAGLRSLSFSTVWP